ncbi:MAG TPA: universal stress protein [Thermoanaerobaculia bacterium]|jgi:nucleotide-binding universal stress UspA family protein|nr:universal stress protein [Thermoanaerobaculia bacterium]
MEPGTSHPVILAATDFSETAEAALEWASELARLQHARLELVHAVTLPPSLSGFVAPGPLFDEELRTAALARLGETAVRFRQTGAEVATHLAIGTPSQVILQRAGELSAAAIVMGTRGLTGLRHLLLGSTTERVMHRAPCPVLSVHPGDRGKHRPIRSILVPTDFSRDAEVAIEAAHQLLAPLEQEARLVLLHAFNLPIEYTAYGPIPTSVDYLKDRGLESERLLEETRERLLREGLVVETVAREGDPAEVIASEAEARGVDLIAMGTHGGSALRHLLIGSTAERVLQHANCPVMTVRRSEE